MDDGIVLHDILAFVSTAELGSVNGAAERNKLAQPVITRRIQRLEAALGVALLDRTVRPVALTAAGVQALAPCRAALQAVAALRDAMGSDQPIGEIRLGVAPPLAHLALAGSLVALRQQYPGITLQVHTEWTPQLLHQLRVGLLDVAVVQMPLYTPLPTGIEARPIGIERLVLVAARQFALDSEVDLATLARLPWVLSPEGEGARVLLEATFRRRNLPLHIVAELEGHMTQVELVAQAVGVGLLPMRVLALHPLRDHLQMLHIPNCTLALRIWAAHAQSAPWIEAPMVLLMDELTCAIDRGLR